MERVIWYRDEFRGESNLVDVLKEKDNVEFVLDSIVKDIEGKFMVERLFLRRIERKRQCRICFGFHCQRY